MTAPESVSTWLVEGSIFAAMDNMMPPRDPNDDEDEDENEDDGKVF